MTNSDGDKFNVSWFDGLLPNQVTDEEFERIMSENFDRDIFDRAAGFSNAVVRAVARREMREIYRVLTRLVEMRNLFNMICTSALVDTSLLSLPQNNSFLDVATAYAQYYNELYMDADNRIRHLQYHYLLDFKVMEATYDYPIKKTQLNKVMAM